MLFPEMVASPVIVTNSRGIASDTIAEHVIAMILALFRRLPLAVRRQWERVWAQEELSAPPGNRMLAGSTVVVVGLGGIGSAVARRLDALGAYVIGVRRRGSEAVGGVARVHVSGEIPGLLPAADVVVIAAPQTHQTRGMFGRAALGAMKPDAILVNVSRGGLVDEDALTEALAAGRLGGAALDVLRDEPLHPASPLWHLPNVLITPHTSGFRDDHWDVITELFSQNLRRFLRGDTLLNSWTRAPGTDRHRGQIRPADVSV